MHVSAPAIIWTYVYACLSAGGDPAAIWSYVFAYRSAGGHMDLRFCMLERRGRGGRGQCGCGSSFVHIEGSAAGEAATGDLC